MIRAAIIGASGYSGEELVRLLLGHPKVALVAVTSRQKAGLALSRVFPRFAGLAAARGIRFLQSEPGGVLAALGADRKRAVVFLALPHGVAAEWAVPLVEAGVRVIDLSADFRLRSAVAYKEFYGHEHPAPALLEKAVYGLPELRGAEVRRARLVASPGCYPTSILVPLVPLLRAGLLKPDGLVIASLSGVSGAGRKVEETGLFCECHESMRAYGVPKHRHLSEIEQELTLAARRKVVVQFTPHLIPVNRGILTSIVAVPAKPVAKTAALIEASWARAYARSPFIRRLGADALPDTKNVVGTNFVEIACRVDPRTGRALIFSAEDNLTKGAAGQAVQSMNLMFGLPETEGLL
ncbi:MAG: N-acetyl-gamma-glutamyl-phosphate reductase [Verrucomicrobiae bacterium]|nr:N-acetyl-gamma-glutamyl-phosphate reductase [Verrucomicrobiae bacterium]